MSTNLIAPVPDANPISRIGRGTIAAAHYFGELTLLVSGAARSCFAGRGLASGLGVMVSAELAWMFAMGLPIVGLIHIGLGSFLSMQAYFGGTFVDGTGAVVGVGLFRNVAPMMAGLTFAGLISARVTPELRLSAIPLIADELGLPRLDRDQDRRVAAKVIAAMIGGFVLTFWACLVGTVVGWRVANQLMGVSTHSFFVMFNDMIWIEDIVGALLKGLIYGGFSAAIACHEGLRPLDLSRPGAIAAATFRSVCLSWILILLVNSGWFLVFYHAGSPFGPTLMATPNS